MKTILTIGGQSYLLPDAADAATVLKQLNGAVRLDDATHYGPDEDRYGDGYFRAEVKRTERERVRVELVDADELFSPAEWEKRCKEMDAQIAAKAKGLPKAA